MVFFFYVYTAPRDIGIFFLKLLFKEAVICSLVAAYCYIFTLHKGDDRLIIRETVSFRHNVPDSCADECMYTKTPVIAAVIIRILYRNALIAKYPCLFTTRSLVCVFFRCGFVRKISSVLQQASYSFGLTYLRFHIFIWFAVHRFMKRLILQPVSLTVA